MILPTREDFVEYGTLDELAACRHFLGKDLHQAELLFRENCGYYCEDLMHMGIKAFCYYVHAAIRYLTADDTDACDFDLSCFISAVDNRLEYDAEELGIGVLTPLRDCLIHILGFWSDYDIDESIYTELRAETKELLRSLSG